MQATEEVSKTADAEELLKAADEEELSKAAEELSEMEQAISNPLPISNPTPIEIEFDWKSFCQGMQRAMLNTAAQRRLQSPNVAKRKGSTLKKMIRKQLRRA